MYKVGEWVIFKNPENVYKDIVKNKRYEIVSVMSDRVLISLDGSSRLFGVQKKYYEQMEVITRYV